MDRRQLEVKVQLNGATDLFFAKLHKNRVKITKVHVAKRYVTFHMNKKDLRMLRKIRRQTRAKVTLRHLNQAAVLQPTAITFLGIFICIVIPLIASQFVWGITVSGTTPEMEKAVQTFLEKELELHAPLWEADFPTEMAIRQQLMASFPTLAWVHVQNRSGNVKLTLQLAPKMETKQQTTAQSLVAKTAGVVTHYFLTTGKMLVSANTTVAKGDILATGVIEGEERTVVTGASGEVFADYWLETSFSMPSQMKYYTATTGNWTIVTHQEPVQQEMTLPKWMKKYVRVVKQPMYTLQERVLEEQDLQTVILPLLQTKFLQTKPVKTTIKAEKVLHLTIDNDTVKGQVLYLVNENIAQPTSMEQGD